MRRTFQSPILRCPVCFVLPDTIRKKGSELLLIASSSTEEEASEGAGDAVLATDCTCIPLLLSSNAFGCAPSSVLRCWSPGSTMHRSSSRNCSSSSRLRLSIHRQYDRFTMRREEG